MEIIEARARLEARLRGWSIRSVDLFGRMRKGLVDPSGKWYEFTDPTTPAGAWEWMVLLKIDIFSSENYWVAEWEDMPHENAGAVQDDPIAAVVAAVNATARQETE